MFDTGQFAIISAELSNLSKKENEERTREMAEYFKRDGMLTRKMEVIEANGVYKGTKEKSFIVKIDSHYDYLWLKSLAKKFDQEAILAVDKRNNAYLQILADNSSMKLGTFHKVPKSVAETLDAYTETEGGYYAC